MIEKNTNKIAFVCDIGELKSELIMPVFWLLPKIGFVVTKENEKYFKGRAIAKGNELCFQHHSSNRTPTFEFIGFNGFFAKKKLAKVTIELLE